MPAPVKQIDPFIFFDEDGKIYLYHVRLSGGNRIFVAELTEDFSSIREETLRECIAAVEPWENTAQAGWPVAEGPAVLKRNGLYYLFYSANDFRNPDYGVGFATSRSPLGPWQKHAGNPVIHKSQLGWNGTGHGDFFTKGRKLFYVLHTHSSANKVAPRRTALLKARFRQKKGEERLEIQPKSFRFLKEGKRS